MCAAIVKSRFPKSKVTVLEQLEQVGKKVLATGNGRCNFSNLDPNEEKYFGNREFIKTALNQALPEEVLSEFEELGMSYSADESGRLYPLSFQAQTVIKLLLRKCKATGVKIITATEVTKATYINGIYNIETNRGDFHSNILILANGGKSGQSLGSNGSGYALAKSLGHAIVPTFPAIVQLKSSSKYPRALKGVRVKANLRLEIDGKITCKNSGEILFTDYGLSGICVMEISRYVSSAFFKNPNSKITVSIDFIPNLTENQLVEKFESLIKNGFQTEELLIGMLPVKLAEIIAKQSDFDPLRIAGIAKNWRLIITGTLGFDYSQVTCGGVETNQIDPTTMMSKIKENLYIIGELMNVDGACGGFNLHWAWVSGIIAGKSIAKKLSKEVKDD